MQNRCRRGRACTAVGRTAQLASSTGGHSLGALAVLAIVLAEALVRVVHVAVVVGPEVVSVVRVAAVAPCAVHSFRDLGISPRPI
eukprot:5963542-Pyramimonas_sp.AAC.1